jgi:hypothetical protein
VTIILTLIGVGLNAVVLRDIFHTLFSPSGGGSLSNAIARAVWRAMRLVPLRNPLHLSLAGPLALVTIIVFWTVGLILGWSFLIWPHLPDQFLLSSGMQPDQNNGFLDAVYLSMVTLSTLGYGEITPHTTWIRIAGPLEALIGFGLLTASISWVMSIYPALARRRNLAREITILQRREQRAISDLSDVSSDAYGDVLHSLIGQVIAVRDDFVQFPITYYFRIYDQESSLEATLPHLATFAERASQHGDPLVRLNAELLLEAIHDLARHVAEQWLGVDRDVSLEEILNLYANDHLHPGKRPKPAE